MSPPWYHKKAGILFGNLLVAFTIPTLLVVWIHYSVYGGINPCHVILNNTCMKNVTETVQIAHDNKTEEVKVVKHVFYVEDTYDFIFRYEIAKGFIPIMLLAALFAILAGTLSEGCKKGLLILTLMFSILSILMGIALVMVSIHAITMYGDPTESPWTLKSTIMKLMVGVSIIQVLLAIAITWVASFCWKCHYSCCVCVFGICCPYIGRRDEQEGMMMSRQCAGPSVLSRPVPTGLSPLTKQLMSPAGVLQPAALATTTQHPPPEPPTEEPPPPYYEVVCEIFDDVDDFDDMDYS